MNTSLPRRFCPDCRTEMVVTGSDHKYGLGVVNVPPEAGMSFRIEVAPYICKKCGLVRLYSWKELQRELGNQGTPVRPEAQE